MKRLTANHKQSKTFWLALATPLLLAPTPLLAMGNADETAVVAQQTQPIVGVEQINPTTVDILFADHRRMTFDFYGENIFRMFQDNNGGIIRDPEAKPEAQILVDNPRKPVYKLEIEDADGQITITTNRIRLQLDKATALLKVWSFSADQFVFEEAKPVAYEKGKTVLTLKEQPDEYFFGGGVQNGRFSHKGKAIAIVNENSWTDGGVASPTPFYWSTSGYGFMWYTFKPGKYDFGADEKGLVKLSHETDYLDVFFMVNNGDDTEKPFTPSLSSALLNDY